MRDFEILTKSCSMILRRKVVKIVDTRVIYENCTAEIISRTMADQDRVWCDGWYAFVIAKGRW